ncbi:MAG: hypothetical protein RLY99_1322, partial [Pseudomonadota bacterium]
KTAGGKEGISGSKGILQSPAAIRHIPHPEKTPPV